RIEFCSPLTSGTAWKQYQLGNREGTFKRDVSTRNQLPADYDINHDSTHFKQSLNEFIQLFYEERQSERRYKNFHKELKCIEEKTIVIACLKGRIWNPWASLATIKKYITIIKELSEEIEKENREIISEIEEAKMNKETESIRKKLLKLEHQLRDMRLKREEVHKCLLNLTQCPQEAVLIITITDPKTPNGFGLDSIKLAKGTRRSSLLSCEVTRA
ncbi:hypothetical protein Goari_022042, partial [Gossypium aridum]|nr:hypothetical protein [Gossypium aridum]